MPSLCWIQTYRVTPFAASRIHQIMCLAATPTRTFSNSIQIMRTCTNVQLVRMYNKLSDLVIEFKIFLVPSAALGSFLYEKRFLILGCMDGEIRVLDVMHTPPYPMFNFSAGNGLKSITCMQVFWETVIFRLHFKLF